MLAGVLLKVRVRWRWYAVVGVWIRLVEGGLGGVSALEAGVEGGLRAGLVGIILALLPVFKRRSRSAVCLFVRRVRSRPCIALQIFREG